MLQLKGVRVVPMELKLTEGKVTELRTEAEPRIPKDNKVWNRRLVEILLPNLLLFNRPLNPFPLL
jgi:hypothetical protein